MNYYLSVLKNYANFSGRARRSEYWFFTLFNVIFAIVAIVLDSVLGISFQGTLGPIYLIYILATLIPALAVCVRRLHDLDKSGWFLLVGLIPIIGSIWLIVLFCTDGTPGENKYGPNPKEIGTAVAA